MTAKTIYFKNLDSIRFFAAMMVFFQHAVSGLIPKVSEPGTFINRFFSALCDGGSGVSLFFVLSGFLITYLLISEYELKQRISIKNFYIRRLLRIWPLYFSIVIFSFLIYPHITFNNAALSQQEYHPAFHFTFLSNFDIIQVESVSPGQTVLSRNVTWSVSIEEQFYLFWPLIFLFFKPKHWLYVIGSVILASILFRLYHAQESLVLYYHSFSVMGDLAIGALFAYLAKSNVKFRSYFEKNQWYHQVGYVLLSLFIIMYFNDVFPFAWGIALDRLALSLSFALLVTSQTFVTEKRQGSFGQFRFANYWGKYTYGIYLIHPIALILANFAVRKMNLVSQSFTELLSIGVLSFVLTLLISKLSYDLFESKFLKFKEKFSTISSRG